MKKIHILLVLSLIIVSSCIKSPSPVDPTTDLDLSFAFGTRTDVQLSVLAKDETGNPSEGVLFSVYTENPYDEEGSRISSFCPIYQGFTEKGGSKSITIPAPTTSDHLYIIPEYAGYGLMQEVEMSEAISVELSGTPQSKSPMTKADDTYSRERINCGQIKQFYTYYISGTDYDQDYGSPLASDIVSSETLSIDFKDYVNRLFPEEGANFSSDICSDMVIDTDGTEIWVTYIGDGGYTNATYNKSDLNSLMYYTYDEGTLPDLKTFFPDVNEYLNVDCGITYAIIDAHPQHIACGTKFQLLYWDGSKYVKGFPAGKRLGFMFLRNGYKTDQNVRKFSMVTGNARFSTPELNPSGNALAVTVWSNEYNCFITGMEFGGAKGDVSNDTDFNDMLLKVTTSKRVSTLNEQSDSPAEETVGYSFEGTLAFEDLWPDKGDYDFNDFVTDYKYTLNKTNRSNQISSVSITFTPKASGAGNSNGFGIQLPILTSNISSIYNGTIDGSNVLATIKVFNKVSDGFVGSPVGFVNTNTASAHIDSNPVTITLGLISPIDEDDCPFHGFNPFIFDASNPGREIHLVDYPPTLSADMSLFGTGVDKSIPEKNIYYRMDDNFPWALDIAKSSIHNWRYPIEKTIITDAYLHYEDWVSDHETNWFDWTVEGNADLSLLYPYFE